MRYALAAILIAMPLYSTFANAAEGDCASAPSQNEANRCAEDDYTAATNEINALYQTVLNKYDLKNQTLLRTAERNWIAFRDSECVFRNAGNAGTSVWPMVHFSCLAELTRERIKQLKAASECQAGDLSCNQNSGSGGD